MAIVSEAVGDKNNNTELLQMQYRVKINCNQENKKKKKDKIVIKKEDLYKFISRMKMRQIQKNYV